jgi:ribosomal protein S18 acetylase RimI-like enzyme
MADFEHDVGAEAAKVFVDAYYKEVSFLTKDKDLLISGFKHTFRKEVTFLAEMNGEIVGMLGCSNNKMRTMYVDKEVLKKFFGRIKGSISYQFMKKEFNSPLTYPDDTGYIECIATMEKSRGRGIATELINYIKQNLPYQKLILEVTDTNESAYRLYKKLDFSEISRKRERLGKIVGFKERIYMVWSR